MAMVLLTGSTHACDNRRCLEEISLGIAPDVLPEPECKRTLIIQHPKQGQHDL